MRRAVAYLRVSSDRQAGNTSIPDQRALVRAHADRNGLTVEAEFVDDGESARVRERLAESFDARPGWRQLVAFLKGRPAARGGPDLVLFKDYSRFSRDAAAYATIHALRRMGVEIQAVEQPIDWEVPEQRPMLGFYLALPETENARRRLNTRRGMVARLEAGVFTHRPPIGHRATHEGGRRTEIEPDPTVAPSSSARLRPRPTRPARSTPAASSSATRSARRA